MSPSTKPGSRSPMSKWRLLRSSPPSSTAIGTTRSSPAKVDDFIVSRLLTVEHVNAAGSSLVKLSGLWQGTTRTGQPYFTGTFGDACKLLIFVNDRKDEDAAGPDWFVFLTPAKQRGPLVLVGELYERTSKAGEQYLSGCL